MTGRQEESGQPYRAQRQRQAAARRSLGRRNEARPTGEPAPASSASSAVAAPPPDSPAPPGEPESAPGVVPEAPWAPYYLDIAAVRIQEWLGRTPDLRFRRGASVLLSKATARETWASRLPAGVLWNEEAGSVDGVVSLALDTAVATTQAGTRTDPVEVLACTARQIVQGMREMMPHCPIQAVVGTGESYAAAYPGMAKSRRDGDLLIDSVPVPAELILAKPCDQCRAAAATIPNVKVVVGEHTQDLCAECHNRFQAAGKTAGRQGQEPAPERRLRKALNDAGMPVIDFSDSFGELAFAGQTAPDNAATQNALIYADGNNIGRFLATAAAAAVADGPHRAIIATLIENATLGALAQAVIDRFGGWRKPPVIVNLAGGDDLLVSVPAADAWLFTKTLLTSFTAILADEASSWPRQVRESVPTLSAGLVFHGAKTPFSDVIRLATQQLLQAKAAIRTSASVAFLDITADGEAPPMDRKPITLSDLDKHASRLRQISALPPSRRDTLLRMLRDDDIEGFIRQLTDFGDNRPLWEIAAGAGADVRLVRNRLSADPDAVAQVRRALDIARHWHGEPRTEPEGSEISRERKTRQ